MKQTKRTLAILLAVLLLALSMPFAAVAEGPGAALTIGGEVITCSSVQDAIDRIPTGGTGTVKVLNQAIGGIVLNADKTVVLDLNSDAFEYVTGYVKLYQGFLTIANGCLKGYTQSINVYASGDETLAEGAYNSLTIAADASIGGDETGYAVILRQAANKTAYGSKIDINGSITGYVWVMGNILNGNAVINVNEGATIFGVDIAVALNGYATLNVTGGAITGGTESEAGTGIEVRAGVLNVTGGTITGYGAMKFSPNGSGTTSTGCGIAVAQHTTKNNIQVTISGDAEVNGTVALAIANPQLNEEGEISVSVAGGTFTSTSEEDAVVVFLADNETRVNSFISGGIFSSVLPEEYFADGAQVKQKVAKAEASEAADGNIEYYLGADGKCFTLSETGDFEEIAQADTVKHYWDYDNAENPDWTDNNNACSVTVPCANCGVTQTLAAKVVSYQVTENPTCQEEGTGLYTATFEDGTVGTKTKEVEIPMIPHDYEDGVKFQQDSNGDYYAYGTCRNHPLAPVQVKATMTEVTPQTCEAAQTVKYVAVINGETFETEVMVNGDPAGHAYQSQGFTWSNTTDPNQAPTAIATFICANDNSHVQTPKATVTRLSSTEPTCVETGTKVYKATVTFEGTVYYDYKTVIVPATGHSYSAWTSNGDGTHTRVCSVCDENTSGHSETQSCSGGEATCSAKAICKDCNTAYGLLNLNNHKNTVEKAAVTANCVTEGFSAGVYCNDCKLYISGHESQGYDYSEAGHTYGTPADTDWTWTWNKETGTYDATVTLTCTRCEEGTEKHQIPVDATVSGPEVDPAGHAQNGSKTYTATATHGDQTFTNTKVDTIPGEAHTWNYASEDVTYTWEGYTKCTATVPCEKCNATTTVDATEISDAITTEATCLVKGIKTYTAAFAQEALSATTTETLDYGAHNYGDLIKAEDPTCEEPGTVAHYTCSVCEKNFANDEEKTELKSIVDPKLGHNWSEATYTWADGSEEVAANSEVTAERHCTREGCGVAETETVEVTGEITTDATCIAAGEMTYTSAEFENEAFAVQEKTVAIDKDPENHVGPFESEVENYVEPTITSLGSYDEVYICTACGKESSRETIDIDAIPHQHEYTSVVTKEPNCTYEGERTFTCQICGNVVTESIATNGKCADPDNDGYCNYCGNMMTGGDHCPQCGKIHNGGFGDRLTGFFHRIAAFFTRLFR